MTSNENYHAIGRVITDLERALGNDLALSYKNKSKPLNLSVALAVSQLYQIAEGQLPNDNSR